MLLSKLFRNSNFSNIKRIIFYYKGKIDAARVFYHLYCVEFPFKIERFRVKVELSTVRGYLKLTSLLGGGGSEGAPTCNIMPLVSGMIYLVVYGGRLLLSQKLIVLPQIKLTFSTKGFFATSTASPHCYKSYLILSVILLI